MNKDDDIIIDIADEFTISGDSSITFWSGTEMTDSITITDDSVSTIDLGNYTLSGDFGTVTLDDSWKSIYPYEVENMCKHYPALEKAWRNFKNVYDMVKQDYEGKKNAGEIDDDIPF